MNWTNQQMQVTSMKLFVCKIVIISIKFAKLSIISSKTCLVLLLCLLTLLSLFLAKAVF